MLITVGCRVVCIFDFGDEEFECGDGVLRQFGVPADGHFVRMNGYFQRFTKVEHAMITLSKYASAEDDPGAVPCCLVDATT